MGNQSDLPQGTKLYAIVCGPNERDSAPRNQPLFPILIPILQIQ